MLSLDQDKEKPMAVRNANIMAARGMPDSKSRSLRSLFMQAVADAIRTSLGPRGMDKMIQNGKGQTIIVGTAVRSPALVLTSSRPTTAILCSKT